MLQNNSGACNKEANKLFTTRWEQHNNIHNIPSKRVR